MFLFFEIIQIVNKIYIFVSHKIGLFEEINDGYLEAISNSCVIFSQLVVKIIESSEKCVEYLKYLKSNIPKPESSKSNEPTKVLTKQKSSSFTRQSSITSFFPETNQNELHLKVH